MEIFLDFLGEPNIITRVLKRERGEKKKGKEGGRRVRERDVAGFQERGRGPQTKECK